MSVVVAHAGHWLANVAYAAPVLVLVGWLGVAKVKEARARRKLSGAHPEAQTSD